MTWEPISESQFQLLLGAQVASLGSTSRQAWEQYRIAPAPLMCIRRTWDGSTPTPEPVHCVARSGHQVLIYDDVEEEFGVGTLDPDGVLRNWGTWGDSLGQSLRHFPEPSTPSSDVSAG